MTDELELGLSQLEANAQERKKRLQEMRLRSKQAKEDAGTATETETKTAMLFRSYDPKESENFLEKLKEKKPEALSVVENEVAEYVAETEKFVVSNRLEAQQIAGTRKIDWDLKRIIQPKMNKLELRTEKAIAKLIRERLSSGKIDLTSAVTQGAAAEFADED
uniref:V-type proton ATPase subunit G n=1 Tax=Panagrellus redivivus TaxID=6233 RepID=A0A7E4VLR9_PANRE